MHDGASSEPPAQDDELGIIGERLPLPLLCALLGHQ